MLDFLINNLDYFNVSSHFRKSNPTLYHKLELSLVEEKKKKLTLYHKLEIGLILKLIPSTKRERVKGEKVAQNINTYPTIRQFFIYLCPFLFCNERWSA